MTNFLKTIGTFFVIIIIFIPLSFVIQKSPNSMILDSFTESKIRETCLISPVSEHFQKCYKKELAKILSSFTPHDSLKILETIKSTYHLDLYHANDDISKTEIELLYFENWILFIENQENMGVNRNDLSFFDIPLIPYIRIKIKNEVKIMLEQYKNRSISKNPNLTSQSIKLRSDRIHKKFSTLTLTNLF